MNSMNCEYNNKLMDATQDEINSSFDSSIELDDLSLTDTTYSLPPQKARAATLQDIDFAFEPVIHTPEKDNNTPFVPPDFSISKAFVGFKNGWDQKDVKVNESKLKKAKKFFDDTQLDQLPDYNTVCFGMPNETEMTPNQPEEFSMPCFKTVGSGAEVKISDNAKQKVSFLFKEFQSIKKPTKMKKTAKITTQSLIKTFNVDSKFKPEGEMQFNANRKTFNWEEYEKEYRKEIQQQIREKSKKKKRTTEAKRKMKNNVQDISKQYVFIKLYSLTISLADEKRCSQALALQTRNISTQAFSHNGSSCTILQCIFCKIKFNGQHLQAKDIYSILNKQFSKKWVNYDQFHSLYLQVCFKLLKYQTYWPEIINKRLHVSNILVQINKKLLQTQKQQETSFLRHCINKDQVGRRINLIIQDKCFNDKMRIVFIKLSDGWTSVWAAIEEKNLLFEYVRDESKAKVGTKLALSLWSIHPISNILHFCSQADDKEAKCIQFFYNGSIILHPNTKLGHINEQFYRPLSKCRGKGGLIPMIQGIIVRLFSTKNHSKRGRNENTYNFSNHYAEILTVEGFVCLIKFSLNEESSLVEYFRLYHTYRIYKLKINEENGLTFLMNQSRYQEIKGGKVSEKDQLYPQSICQLLTKRLLNVKREEEWEDGVFDVMCKDGKIILREGKEYEFEVQGENGSYSSLYQQARVQRITNNFIKIVKTKQSSQLRKFPKVYDKLIQAKQ